MGPASLLIVALTCAAPVDDGPALSGRVVDRQGRPVAGATVFRSGDPGGRAGVETDEQARFTLPGARGFGPVFVFARKDGHRFTGAPARSDGGEITLTLTGADEPSPEVLRTLPPALPHDEELAVARRLLDPYAARALEEGDEAAKIRTLEALARVEPARVLEWLDGNAQVEPMLGAMIRVRVADGLVGESPEEAAALVEAVGDPGMRAFGLIAVADALPNDQRDRKLELLDRAEVHARLAQEPLGMQVVLQGQVAERWLDLGLTDRAEGLLREARKEAEQLPPDGWPGYARGAFAEELAQIDLEAALALTTGLADTYEYDRHHGNIAHELAGKDPDAAERVLGMVGKHQPPQRDNYAVRVVYRMAPVDLDRARRVVASIEQEELRAYALGMMALALAETGEDADSVAARGLLDEAFQVLEHAAEVGWDRRQGMQVIYTPAPVAGALLPVAEAINPALVPEFLWRALSLRLPVPAGDRHDINHEMAGAAADMQLALMLARYDRDLARSLLEPIADPSAPPSLRHTGRADFEVAAAVVDPAWAAALVEGLPDDPDLRVFQRQNEARLAVAQALARTGERRWKYFQNKFLYIWVPDIEDIAAGL